MSPFDINEDPKDLKKKWANTMVRLKLDNDFEPVLIKDFLDNNLSIKCCHSKHGTILIEANKYEWDVTLPERGWFNSVGGAHFCCHYSIRQWQKGVCNMTMHFFRPTINWRTPSFMLQLGAKPNISNFDNVSDAWEGRHITLDQAVPLLRGYRKLEVAISREIALTLSPLSECNLLVIWYDLTPIGWYDDKKDQILINNTAFHQELFDFVKRNKLSCLISTA